MQSLLYKLNISRYINKMAGKITTLLVFLILAGCSVLPHILYKIDVQQGNVVTDEMLDKLKQDMTKSQVRFVLGSPLIVDAFRDDRWDYVYIQREKGDLVEQKRLTIYFKDDRLMQFENQMLYSLHPLVPAAPKTEKIIDKEMETFSEGEQ
ncbi:outer membrane protein assembly factor BamE [Nitrosomonas aestuarii]|uniref:Outer membrane protein assembly factor BamE n=2 Tax=Nitrosomonas aestuarii TaxID=52441 RepID=A0A1I4A825_9PROT|nr:outer membrane protein assembly factor BamE [Nitrosomonas aestuarii]SFK52464.1 outer membrane protein assembly factor BamE [Nitrosomonas aestuarii]